MTDIALSRAQERLLVVLDECAEVRIARMNAFEAWQLNKGQLEERSRVLRAEMNALLAEVQLASKSSFEEFSLTDAPLKERTEALLVEANALAAKVAAEGVH